jgi:hypothetical protein
MSKTLSSTLRSISVPTSTGSLTPTLTQTANYTAYVNDMVLANSTSAAFNITLPTVPANGSVVAVVDIASSFSSRNVTILPGVGATIDGAASSKLSTNGSYTQFVYISSTTNWQTQTTAASSGAANMDGGNSSSVYGGSITIDGGASI